MNSVIGFLAQPLRRVVGLRTGRWLRGAAAAAMLSISAATPALAQDVRNPGGKGTFPVLNLCLKTPSRLIPEICPTITVHYEFSVFMGEPTAHFGIVWKPDLLTIASLEPNSQARQSYSYAQAKQLFGAPVDAIELSAKGEAWVSSSFQNGVGRLLVDFDSGVATRPGTMSWQVGGIPDWHRFIRTSHACGRIGHVDSNPRKPGPSDHLGRLAAQTLMREGGWQLSHAWLCIDGTFFGGLDALEGAVRRSCESGAQPQSKAWYCPAKPAARAEPEKPAPAPATKASRDDRGSKRSDLDAALDRTYDRAKAELPVAPPPKPAAREPVRETPVAQAPPPGGSVVAQESRPARPTAPEENAGPRVKIRGVRNYSERPSDDCNEARRTAAFASSNYFRADHDVYIGSDRVMDRTKFVRMIASQIGHCTCTSRKAGDRENTCSVEAELEDLAKAKTWIVPIYSGYVSRATPDDQLCAWQNRNNPLDPSRELRTAIGTKFYYREYDGYERDRLKPFRDELERRRVVSVERVCHCAKVNHEPGAREPYACYVDHVFRFE